MNVYGRVLLAVACVSFAVQAQTPPPYYIFDTHLHAIENFKNPLVYETDGAACTLADIQTAAGAVVSGCSPQQLPVYNYPTIVSLIRTNMHGASNIARSLALSGSQVRNSGYQQIQVVCGCETGFPAVQLANNTPDLRMLAATDPLLLPVDPDEVKATIAAFGACEDHATGKPKISLNYLTANRSKFRWAGEMDNGCWESQLAQQTGPAPQMLQLLDQLKSWDIHHGTVLGTHLPIGMNYAGFNTTTGGCAALDVVCAKFKSAVEAACGARGVTVHQTHGHIHWGQLGAACTGGNPAALDFLKYWFGRYDSDRDGFYQIEVQWATDEGFCPGECTPPLGEPPDIRYCTERAVTAPDCIIDWFLDPLVSRHITIGTHKGNGHDFAAAGCQYGINSYGGWDAYWDEVFRRMWVRGGQTAAACEAIQNISHGNVERMLRVPSLTGYGCGAGPDVVTGQGLAASNAAQFRTYRYDGRVPASTNGYASAYSAQYGLNVAAGAIGGDSSFGATIVTGPGPGVSLGPHVKGWNWYGTGGGSTHIANISFFAYGTLNYGVNVVTGDIDGDGNDEILTAPGPGSVFAPQVRGWNYDGGLLQTIAKVNFNAFTGGYGANVGASNVDNSGFGEAYDEVVVAHGPGPALDTEVKVFDYDNAAIVEKTAGGFSPFVAYAGALYGTRVAGLQVDSGKEEIVTGPGAGPGNGSNVKVWKHQTSWLPAASATLFQGSVTYGANVGATYFDECGAGPCNPVLAGEAQDPDATTRVRALRFDAGPPGSLLPIVEADWNAFSSDRHYGATVAGVPSDERFVVPGVPGGDSGFSRPIVVAEGIGGDAQTTFDVELVRVLRALVASCPDSTTRDPMLLPGSGWNINVWRSDEDKVAALRLLDRGVTAGSCQELVSALSAARGIIELGLEHEMARGEIVAALNHLIASCTEP